MRFSTILMAIIGFGAMSGAPVRSATASEVILASSAWFTGQDSGTDTFSVSGPGTLTVTLTNDVFPVALASLNGVVSTSQGLLGPEMGVGTNTFQVTGGGEVIAQWFGTAQGPLDVGAYGVKIEFTPVPLPASIVLLLSAMALLLWQRRERSFGGWRV